MVGFCDGPSALDVEWSDFVMNCGGTALLELSSRSKGLTAAGPPPNSLNHCRCGASNVKVWLGQPMVGKVVHNNSLERTQPQRDFMYDVAVLRRSARGRYAEFGCGLNRKALELRVIEGNC